MEPKRPTRLSELAMATLKGLEARGLGHMLSIGGAVGLAHYHEYRETRDVDAWWSPEATGEERGRVLEAIEEALRPHGLIRRRSWGDVVSIDLLKEGRAVFEFQIASRSVELEEPVSAGWVDVRLDSLNDLIASKMVALVERGAPRDFRDIHAVCTAGLLRPRECWELWRRRHAGAGGDDSAGRARLAVETHLERIERHRPLDGIEEPAERARAEKIRSWTRGELLDALHD